MRIESANMAARNGDTPSVGDVAALAHWFKADELPGASSVVCSVTGLTLPAAVTSSVYSNAIKIQSATDAVPSITPTPMGSGDFMLVCSGDLQALSAVRFGAVSGAMLQIGTVLGNALNDGTNPSYVSGAMTNTSSMHSMLVTCDADSATGFNAYEDSMTTEGADSLTVPAYAGVIFGDFMTIGGGNSIDTHGIALFKFSTTVSAAELIHRRAIGLWMTNMWAAGYRVLHPECVNW
jgi:hypothetical protein